MSKIDETVLVICPGTMDNRINFSQYFSIKEKFKTEHIIDVLKRRRWSNDTNISNVAVLSHYKLTLTRALYCETPPSLSTARIGALRPVTAEDRKGAAERERQNLVFFTSDISSCRPVPSILWETFSARCMEVERQ